MKKNRKNNPFSLFQKYATPALTSEKNIMLNKTTEKENVAGLSLTC